MTHSQPPIRNPVQNPAHIPVMLHEVLETLSPRDGEVYVDATLGAGGYTRAILEKANCIVYGFDRDPRAIAAATAWAGAYGDRLVLIEAPFADMEEVLAERGVSKVHGVVFDLGVSSMQLDEADRGFSFQNDGPLSMRMDGGKPDAADIVNSAEANDLKAIFRIYGEEKRASALTKAITRARDKTPFVSTKALADIIEAASPNRYAGKGKAIHPATRVFQALRIFVNDELGQLAKALVSAENLLTSGGRLIAVSFHSLESRIVKRFFADRTGAAYTTSRHQPLVSTPPATFDIFFRGQKSPSVEEEANNPRARSASMRAGLRTDAAPQVRDLSFAGLPSLSLSSVFHSVTPF